MDSVTNKTQLAEKRYRDKRETDKEEVRLNNKKHKYKIKKLENMKKIIKNIIGSYKKQKSTKIQKKKQYELNKRR